jgi:hypothetical protein
MDFVKLKNRILKKIVYFLKLDRYIDLPNKTAITEILENEYGHAKSREKKQCLNKTEHPLPWFTYPAIEYLQQLNLKDKVILEWGTGNSSLFFSERAETICSIEHNLDWHHKILSLNIFNQNLQYREEAKYVEAIKDFHQRFDIIVIDGILREKCAAISLEYIKDDGLIILDNSDRDPQIAEYFRENNLIEVDMHGFGPINDYTWTTSFFFMRNFNFRPLGNQPVIPIGGGY